MSYRPITDTWYLARTKVKYYGAYPGGFLERARALLGVHLTDPVLHVCAGHARHYPYKRGFGPYDMTLDLDPTTQPDYLRDARGQLPFCKHTAIQRHWQAWYQAMRQAGASFKPPLGELALWPAILADPPYSEADAKHYSVLVHDKLPAPRQLLINCLSVLRPGGRVGILHERQPRPPADVILVATITVVVGFENRGRIFSVYEKPWTPESDGSMIGPYAEESDAQEAPGNDEGHNHASGTHAAGAGVSHDPAGDVETPGPHPAD